VRRARRGVVIDRIEIAATILLSCAALATAWSSYQASRWNGEQAKAFSRATGSRIESTKASGLANAQTQVDVATFTQWIDAYARKQTRLADFYFARFRPEFRPAVNAWIESHPLRNPGAPLTPFAMPQYRLAAKAEAERLEAAAEAFSTTARRNVQRATNYVLAVVLFAASLFFAGISTKLRQARARGTMVALGWVLFLATLVWVAASPVSFSF
jgi:hypothetical protein